MIQVLGYGSGFIYIYRGLTFPDFERRHGPRNSALLTVEPPDAAASQRQFCYVQNSVAETATGQYNGFYHYYYFGALFSYKTYETWGLLHFCPVR